MLVWIFVGVVVATTMFLMVMYQNNREELRTQAVVTTAKIRELEAKQALETPRDEMMDRQSRKMIEELKMDLQLTELECKNLQEQIRVISERRDQLTKEVTKQQQLFNNAMNSLVTDLRFTREGSADAGKAVVPEIGPAATTGDAKGRTGMLFGHDAAPFPFPGE